VQPGTFRQLLATHARTRGDAPAILAPGGPALSYAELRTHVERTGAALAALGLGRATRVAFALRGGRDTASALVASLPWTACAPLNPDLEADAYRRLFPSLRVTALVARAGDASAAVAVAKSLGLQLLTLAAPGAEDGAFALPPGLARRAVSDATLGPDDASIVFHTSGTTAAPKVVPVTQAQLLARYRAYPLTSDDRCLCAAPLFTSTGLAHGLLGPLVFGGSVICVPQARPEQFLDWLDELRPTFVNASPAFLMALADVLGDGPRRSSLRFLRSTANALPSTLRARLEASLGVPVIDGYGMTETGTIVQTPLSAPHRPGSIGVPLWDGVVVADERGRPLPPRATGEVMVRGPGVMSGYENDPEANRAAFVDGWFRTGDLGYFDEAGYLFLRGRAKEMINRGGNKVWPADLDDVLLRHPAVVDAAAFGVAHPSLGEDVAAAVVLDPPDAASETALRDFCREHLAAFQVPTRILAVKALPRNAAGKVNRGELAAALQADLRPPFAAPRDTYEELVASAFAQVLGTDGVGVLDNFFALGGDSLRGGQAIARINAALHASLPIASLFRRPTAAELAVELRAAHAGPDPATPPPIRPRRGARHPD
jgi:acyl-CoA synthetase (AMP-forming)/AMP-acid ligase II